VQIQGREPDAGHHHPRNYFRLYEKIAGMTGTAPPRPTSPRIYKMDVVVIPPHAMSGRPQ